MRARLTRNEEGAVAVEAALLLPILCLIVFGMIDFSLALRDYNMVVDANRIGARIAATGAGAGPGTCDNSGPTPPPCTPASAPALAQAAADAIQSGMVDIDGSRVERLLVYKANSAGYPGSEGSTTMPSSCSGVANCVMFTWRSNSSKFRYNGGSWDSKGINGCINEQDTLGVYLQVKHTMATGFFIDSLTLSDRAVMRFEPLSADSCKPGTVAAHP